MFAAAQASHLFLLNIVRGVSIISSVFLLTASITMLVKGFPHLTVSSQNVFQELLRMLFLVPASFGFLGSDFEIALQAIETVMPGLGRPHGTSPLGILQLIAASILLAESGAGVETGDELGASAFTFVKFSGWFLLVVGCLNCLLVSKVSDIDCLTNRESYTARRPKTFEALHAKTVLQLHQQREWRLPIMFDTISTNLYLQFIPFHLHESFPRPLLGYASSRDLYLALSFSR